MKKAPASFPKKKSIPAFKSSLTLHVTALRDEGPCSYRSFTGRADGAATDSLRSRPARQPLEGSVRAPIRALCPMLQGFTGGALCRAAPPPEPWVGNDLRQREEGAGHDRVRLVIPSGSRERSDPKSGRVEGLKAVRGAGIAPPFVLRTRCSFSAPHPSLLRGQKKDQDSGR